MITHQPFDTAKAINRNDVLLLMQNVLQIPHITPISYNDYELFQSFFRRDPFNRKYSAIYANSWIYITQAARGFGLGLKFHYRQLLVTIGVKVRFDGLNLVVIRPINLDGEQSDDLINLLEQLFHISARPVFIKKAFPDQLKNLRTEDKLLTTVEYKGANPKHGQYPWDEIVFADDDTYPEMIYELSLSLNFEGRGFDKKFFEYDNRKLEEYCTTYLHNLRYYSALKNKLTKFARQIDSIYTKFHFEPYTLNQESVVTKFLAQYFEFDNEENIIAYKNMLSNPFISMGDQFYAYVVYSSASLEPVGFFYAERLEGAAAGLYSGVVLRTKIGLSEFIHTEMMRHLRSHGIRLLSRGGSETQGLYTYKRKFAPIEERNMPMVVYGEKMAPVDTGAKLP